MKFSKKRVKKVVKVEEFAGRNVLTFEAVKMGAKATKRMVFNKDAFSLIPEESMFVSPVYSDEKIFLAVVSSEAEIRVNKSRTMNSAQFYDEVVAEFELDNTVNNNFELIEATEDELDELREEDEEINFQVFRLSLITDEVNEEEIEKITSEFTNVESLSEKTLVNEDIDKLSNHETLDNSPEIVKINN